MQELDAAVDESVIETYGRGEIVKEETPKRDERADRLTEIGNAIADLTRERYVRQVFRPDYDKLVASLQEEYDRLYSEPPGPPPKPKIVPTGVTVAQYWATLSTQQKRQFLLDHKLHVVGTRDAKRRSKGGDVITVIGPDPADPASWEASSYHSMFRALAGWDPIDVIARPQRTG